MKHYFCLNAQEIRHNLALDKSIQSTILVHARRMHKC